VRQRNSLVHKRMPSGGAPAENRLTLIIRFCSGQSALLSY
jgi:hypothetical protein